MSILPETGVDERRARRSASVLRLVGCPRGSELPPGLPTSARLRAIPTRIGGGVGDTGLCGERAQEQDFSLRRPDSLLRRQAGEHVLMAAPPVGAEPRFPQTDSG